MLSVFRYFSSTVSPFSRLNSSLISFHTLQRDIGASKVSVLEYNLVSRVFWRNDEEKRWHCSRKTVCAFVEKKHEKILTCAPLFVEGGGRGGDCRGREPNVAGFQARRAHDCAPTLLKRQRREQISRKNKKKTFMDATPQKRGIVALCFLQHPRTSNQWVWVCMLFFLCKCEGNRVSLALQQSKQSKPHALRSLSEPCIAERLWLRFSLLWFVTFKPSLMGI